MWLSAGDKDFLLCVNICLVAYTDFQQDFDKCVMLNSVKCLGVINETNTVLFAFPDIFPPLFATGILHPLFFSLL